MATRKRSTGKATLRVRTSFDGFRRGEEIEATLDGPVTAWVELGLMEVTAGGKDPAGSSSTEQDLSGDEQE